MGACSSSCNRRRPRRAWPRLGRIAVSAVCTAALTALLCGVAGIFEPVGRWIAAVQFMPAAVSFAVVVFAAWIVATLAFGRIYCSTVCPLGFYQDVLGRLPRLTPAQRRRRPLRWAAPYNGLRYVLLLLVGGCLVAGVLSIPGIVDPYSVWERVCADVIRPAIRMGAASLAGCVIAATTLALVGALAAWRGRLWCNTVCPVGTTLGIVSRYALMHFDIDTDRCTNCRLCEYACKAQCINLDDHVVDMSRCVVCFDCLDRCEPGAMRYTLWNHTLSLPMMQKIGRPGAAAGLSGLGSEMRAQTPTTPNTHSHAPISRPAPKDT